MIDDVPAAATRMTDGDDYDGPAVSNVLASPNVYRRRPDADKADDVAFRVRVRGRAALRWLAPPGAIDLVGGHIEIMVFSRSEEAAALAGTADARPFRLLKTQRDLLRAIDCASCRRFVQGDGGGGQGRLVSTCLCQKKSHASLPS